MSRSARSWHAKHVSDPYVQKAQQAGYRARSAYKLEQLQQKHHIVRQGMTLLDLGAAPGSWSQLLAHWVGPRGRVFACDRLEMMPIPGVTVYQGDLTDNRCIAELQAMLPVSGVDGICSDMAPNLTGVRVVDAAKMETLTDLVFDLLCQILKPGGFLLIKLFEDGVGPVFRVQLKAHFERVVCSKPPASRSGSKEFYVLAQAYRGMQH